MVHLELVICVEHSPAVAWPTTAIPKRAGPSNRETGGIRLPYTAFHRTARKMHVKARKMQGKCQKDRIGHFYFALTGRRTDQNACSRRQPAFAIKRTSTAWGTPRPCPSSASSANCLDDAPLFHWGSEHSKLRHPSYGRVAERSGHSNKGPDASSHV